MLNKRFGAEYKALTPEEGATKPGEFEAVVAVFDNVDREGDRVKSGAFDRTLEAWRKAGDPIPIVLAHQWGDAWAHIGYAMPEHVKAVPGRGLVVQKGVLDVDDNPLAKQVHRLMERRTLKEFSFGYRIAEGGEQKAEDGAYDLTDLDLIEFGPCLKGVNEETELLAVKSAVEAQARRERGDEPSLEDRIAALEAKAYVSIQGTLEERQEAVRHAVNEAHAPENGHATVEGTYGDSVVYCIYSDEAEPSTWRASYTYSAEGAVELGEPEAVEVSAVVEPKSEEAPAAEEAEATTEDEGEKALDLNLQIRLAQLRQLEGSLHDVVARGSVDETNGKIDAKLAELGGE